MKRDLWLKLNGITVKNIQKYFSIILLLWLRNVKRPGPVTDALKHVSQFQIMFLEAD